MEYAYQLWSILTYTHKIVSGLMKVKTDDTDASISCSVAIYQNLLVACYRGMALLVSTYMYCLASYHAVELCRLCIYFHQIPLALGIRVLINILVVFLLLDFTC